jgi:hypothetical protein
MSAGQYVSALNQTPVDKISQSASTQSSSSLQGFASSISSKLVAAGASFGAVSSSTTTALDAVSPNLRGDTKNLTQTTTERLSPNQLITARKSTAGKSESFATSHMPKKVVETTKLKQSAKELVQFPPDMRKYYINFAFGKYDRPSAYVQTQFVPDLEIALPMPANLLDPTGVKLNPSELGGMIGGAAENLAAIVQDIKGATPTKQGSGTVNMAAGAVYNTLYDIGSALPGLDNLTGVAGQLFGAIPNPHVTVFFQGVDLRAHSFTWKFAPKNEGESKTIQRIIREFKKRMLPNYKWGAANVLGYPQMVQISLEPNMNEALYSFKKCMISSVNVNYAPNGVPSFFAGTKYPTLIEFQVNLQELEIFTSQDYGGQDGDLQEDITASVERTKASIKETLTRK